MNKITSVFIGIIVIIIIVAVFFGKNSANEPKVLKIAVSTVQTGPAAFIGESYLMGLKAAQDDINFKGGINGKRVELLVQDNKNSAQEGISVFHNLVLQKPDIFITTMSVPSVPVSPLAEQAGMPLFVSVVFADITSKNQNSVSFFPTPNDDVAATMQDMVMSGVKKVAVIYLNSEYGQAGLSAFVEMAKKYDINIVGQESFLDGAVDFITPVTKVLASRPDVVYVIAINSSPIIKQIKAYKSNVIIYTNLLPVFGNLVNKDPQTFEGVHLTAGRVSIPGTSEYEYIRKNLNNVQATSTLGYTSIGYDNLKAIAAVLSRNPSVKDFVNNFSSYGLLQGLGGDFVLNSRNVGMKLYPVVFEKGLIKEVK